MEDMNDDKSLAWFCRAAQKHRYSRVRVDQIIQGLSQYCEASRAPELQLLPSLNSQNDP